MAFLTGSRNVPDFVSGKIDGSQVDPPRVTLTRIDPKPGLGKRGIVAMSAECPVGTVTNTQAAWPVYSHSSASNRWVSVMRLRRGYYCEQVSETLPPCPSCSSKYAYEMGALLVCPMCAHEWSVPPVENTAEEPGVRVITDAFGTVLADGDSVTVLPAVAGGSR